MADMTYSDSNASIFQNEWFRGRVRTSVSKYVNYMLNTDPGDPTYADKIAHATRLTNQYSQIVDQLLFTLSGDAEVIAGGPAIPDATLQQIVEKTIAKYYPVTAVPAAMGYPYYPPPPPPPRPQ